MLLSYIHLLWPFNHLLLQFGNMEREICNLHQSSSMDLQCKYDSFHMPLILMLILHQTILGDVRIDSFQR